MSAEYSDPQHPFYVDDPRAVRLEPGRGYCSLCEAREALWVAYATMLCDACAKSEYDRRKARRDAEEASGYKPRVIQSLPPDQLSVFTRAQREGRAAALIV